MKLIEIAQIYVDLVNLEKDVPDFEFHAKDEINALRSKYHNLLMQKMREENVEFSDRFDAMNKVFELVKKERLSA